MDERTHRNQQRRKEPPAREEPPHRRAAIARKPYVIEYWIRPWSGDNTNRWSVWHRYAKAKDRNQALRDLQKNRHHLSSIKYRAGDP